MFISKLTSADIQSTITPDEGRNVPWHIYNMEACDNAKQALIGMDGLMEMVELKKDGPLREMAAPSVHEPSMPVGGLVSIFYP